MTLLENMQKLRILYIEIGKYVQKYGNGKYSAALELLMDQIRCIDSEAAFEEKREYLLNGYDSLFVNNGGLSDFIIYEPCEETRIELNEKFQEEVTEIFKTIKEIAKI